MRQLWKQSPGPSQTDVFWFPLPFLSPPLWIEFLNSTAEKPLEKKHTVSGVGGVWGWGLQKFKLALHVKITAVQKMVQYISPGLKRTFPVLKNDAGLEKMQLFSDQTKYLAWCYSFSSSLLPIPKDASLLRAMITEHRPTCFFPLRFFMDRSN